MTGAAAGPGVADRSSSRVHGWWARHGLSLYVALTCAAGASVVAAMVLRAGEAEVSTVALLVVVALSLFADLPLLETRIGRNRESLTFSELCVILSIVLVPLPYAVLIATACSIVFDITRRIALTKAGFNAANFALAMSAAGWVAHSISPTSLADTSPRSVLALVLATFAFILVNSGGVALALALSQGASFFGVYRQGLTLRLCVAGLNATIALLILALAIHRPSTLLLLPLVLASMYFAYRGYLKAAHERDVWQQLESVTRELNSLDMPTVVGAALSRSAQLFKADTVVVALDAPGGAVVYTGDAGGLEHSGPASSRSFRHHGEAPSTDGRSTTLYTEPLQGPRGPIGVLELGFHGPVQLNRREQQVLKTLAHSVSTTLQNALLYGEMRSHAEAKAYEASHDALTGLGNRTLLQERATAAVGEGTPCALLIVDLDHFKEINDTLGHAAGDELLRGIGARVAEAVPQADAVCRLGGDEFAVLLAGLPDAETADEVAARLLRVLAEPVVFDGLRLSVEGSVGIACFPDDASSFDELLQRADVALYQAKDTRGAFAHYRAERDESSLDRLALAAELRTAMLEDQMVVHFQPQYDLATGVLTGAEALVRWQHPERGLLSPGEFMSAVEHSGLIREFTLTVLEKATAEAAAWSSDRPMNVAVNLSARNLLDRQLPADVARVLQRHGLAPERLVLEITETTMMSELDVVEDVLARLRRLGVELSVDDFGTGYSSLAFLQRVQVNEVKVDRSFVAGLSTSASARALVRATVQLAHGLGARTVGEGVEDQALADVLSELGCDLAQGYHLGRPMPAQDLRRLLGMADASVLPSERRESDRRHLRAVAVAPA